MKLYHMQTDQGILDIQVIQSNRRTISFEVQEDGTAIARVPVHMPKQRIAMYLESRKEWYMEKVSAAKSRVQKAPEYTIPAPEELTAEQVQAIRQKFTERVAFYAAQMGVTYAHITLRNQKTRWGSCSSKGNLNFNYQLYFLPEELMDYVIVHELAHRVHMNHSPEFWALVAQHCPEYQERRARLKAIGIQK